MSLFDSAKALNEGLFYILMVGFSIFLAVDGQITIGAIVTFSGLYLGVMAPLREVHRILDDAHESSIRVGMLLEMMNEPLDDSFQLPTIRRPVFDGKAPVIAAQDLGLDYRTADGKLRRALRGVALDVRRGETIGVAGPSGSGKSSWLKVVMRLVHPTDGSVFIGGEPLEAISREVIGETFGYVSQIPFVFAGTVAENIAYGSGEVSQEDIERAARLAFIHDEIMAMPAGYQTILAERGQNLSGGQRQRIALARIFLKNPPILILDEATSALDNISERKIQQALAEARKDRTVILVAHRLTTLKDADRILVFDNGQIVEEGAYETLLRRGGVFTALVKSANEGLAASA
jgi:ATP-binding cassette subfamily B protein